jgi:hypothetical protein
MRKVAVTRTIAPAISDATRGLGTGNAALANKKIQKRMREFGLVSLERKGVKDGSD